MVDIRNDVETFKHVSVGTECFEIDCFLGGDWKFIRVFVVLVLQVHLIHVFGANAHYMPNMMEEKNGASLMF